LIDFYAYALENGIDYNPWSYHNISVSVVKKIAEKCKIEFQVGDILFLRTGMATHRQSAYSHHIGFVSCYENMSEAELIEVMELPEYHYPGLEGSLESLEWLWDTGFAAVAGDNPGFEAWCK
jgi:Putative cyclase